MSKVGLIYLFNFIAGDEMYRIFSWINMTSPASFVCCSVTVSSVNYIRHEFLDGKDELEWLTLSFNGFESVDVYRWAYALIPKTEA